VKTHYILLLLALFLLLVSCVSGPSSSAEHEYLCKINADGTGFKKLIDVNELPFPIASLKNLYISSGEKLVFEADKYYVTKPDTLDPQAFSDILTDANSGLTFTDDDRAYFCTNGDLFRYSFPLFAQFNLTGGSSGYLTNPIVSSDNSTITLCQKDPSSVFPSKLFYFQLPDSVFHNVAQAGNFVLNGAYNPNDHKLYYEQSNGLYKIDRDGTHSEQLLSYLYNTVTRSFSMSAANTYLHFVDKENALKIFRVSTNSLVFSKKMNASRVIVRDVKNANKIFFVSNGSIYYYDLDLLVPVKIENTLGVEIAMCPTWDGTKIYYIAKMK
jgi:hypothetical protein